MNWKKWLKYIGITLIVLTIISAVVFKIGMDRTLTQMYGANTQVVDISQFSPVTGPVAIKNVNVLTPNSEAFIAEQTVIIEDGVIKKIGDSLEISTQLTVIDGSGKYLIPGLIDSHVHLFYSPNDLLLYIANGVTEIREMIGNEERLALKKQIENGRIGPQMWVASPPLGTANDLMSYFISWTREATNVSTAEKAAQAVQNFAEQGYDGVKIYSHLNRQSYLAANKKAQELGLPVFGHIPWEVSLADVWENGQSEIAHLEELMKPLRKKIGYPQKSGVSEFLDYVKQRSQGIADTLIANDIAVTSTLWLVESFVRQKFELDKVLTKIELPYVNAGMVEGVKFRDNGFGWLPETNLYRLPKGLTEEQKAGEKEFWETYAKACQILATTFSKKGVKLMAGTDANVPPTVPGFSFHDELLSLQKVGMTNAQILQAATTIPANFMKSKSGKIQVGYHANLVLLNKNPLINIQHTQTINTVFSNGKIYDRSLLNQLLAAVKNANDASRTIDISQY